MNIRTNIIKIVGSSLFFLFIIPSYAQESRPTIAQKNVFIGSVDKPTTVQVWLHNLASKKIVITKIESDCKCTKPTFSSRPLSCGDSSKISITYSPNSDKGVFYKEVKVFTTYGKEPLKFAIRGINTL